VIKEPIEIRLDGTQRGADATWYSLTVQIGRGKYGVEAVRVADGRVSVFEVWNQKNGIHVRRDSQLRRDLEQATKSFVEAL
jgi:hypothetical protein